MQPRSIGHAAPSYRSPLPGFIAVAAGLAVMVCIASEVSAFCAPRMSTGYGRETGSAVHFVAARSGLGNRAAAADASMATDTPTHGRSWWWPRWLGIGAGLLAGSAPAFAAASKPFALFGYTSSQLFSLQQAALVPWVFLILLPKWKRTKNVVVIVPLVYAALYATIMVHIVSNPTGMTMNFSSLEAIMKLFTNKDGVFAAWLHYLVFDPLVGLGIVLDSRSLRIPHLLVVPCLVLTMFLGPIGFLSYVILRSLFQMYRYVFPKHRGVRGVLMGQKRY